MVFMKKWSLFFLLGAITLVGLINSADLPVRPSPSQIKKVDLAERNEREQAFKAVSAKLSDDRYKQQRAHSRYLKWENYQWPHQSAT